MLRINKKKALKTASAAAVIIAVSVYAVRTCITRTRTEMVFNEEDIPYEELLNEGLPDGSREPEGVGELVRKLLGFDVREPETIIESYSSVFDETETAPPEAATPSPASEADALPAFGEISSSTGISVSNATSYSVNADALCAEPLNIELDESGPQILIVHTHTTECYSGDGMNGDSERSVDGEKNMIAVGEIMKAVFEGYGIECVHDTTVHDYPTYQGAYTRELETVKNNMSKYPSVKLVFDVHRDAFVYNDGSKLRVACDIDGVPTAKVMIVCGTDAMGLSHPQWRENFKLASKIQNAAQIMYPGMMRPINLRRERFNMHTTNGSLLFEVGSNGNTLAEAKEGAENVARAVAAVLLNRK